MQMKLSYVAPLLVAAADEGDVPVCTGDQIPIYGGCIVGGPGRRA